MSSIAMAQAADIPPMASNGDFNTIRVLGNAGTYAQVNWLVVDPDVEGLNCRDNNGKTVVKLRAGSVIQSAQVGGEAMVLLNGQLGQKSPWLRANVQLDDVQYRATPQVRDTYTCLVRANRKFIFPILNDQIGVW